MPGVTEQEIAQAKQMNLYQYMQLCEPDNFKPEGPGQFRHKGHSSLTFAEDGSWTYFKTKATGRTALNYLIAVEGVSFVEAVREINRIQGGVRPSFQPVKAPPPPAEKKPAKEFRLPKPDKNNYAATAYLRKRCIHPNVLTVCKQKKILYTVMTIPYIAEEMAVATDKTRYKDVKVRIPEEELAVLNCRVAKTGMSREQYIRCLIADTIPAEYPPADYRLIIRKLDELQEVMEALVDENPVKRDAMKLYITLQNVASTADVLRRAVMPFVSRCEKK